MGVRRKEIRGICRRKRGVKGDRERMRRNRQGGKGTEREGEVWKGVDTEGGKRKEGRVMEGREGGDREGGRKQDGREEIHVVRVGGDKKGGGREKMGKMRIARERLREGQRAWVGIKIKWAGRQAGRKGGFM